MLDGETEAMLGSATETEKVRSDGTWEPKLTTMTVEAPSLRIGGTNVMAVGLAAFTNETARADSSTGVFVTVT